MEWWWSWLLTAVGVTGLWVAGRRNRWGWAIGLGAQALWIAYAVSSRQWGFLVSSLAYGTVYARNLYRWSRERALVAAQERIHAQMRGAFLDLATGGRPVLDGRPSEHVLRYPLPTGETIVARADDSLALLDLKQALDQRIRVQGTVDQYGVAVPRGVTLVVEDRQDADNPGEALSSGDEQDGDGLPPDGGTTDDVRKAP